jgi:uncharacterized protein YjdB
LTAGDITIQNGTGVVAKGALTGGGTDWELALTGVTTQGNVSLFIAKSGIENATKTVAVYKASSASGAVTVSLNKATQVLRSGESVTLIATVTPAAAADQGVTWSTSDASVATVDANGRVTRVGSGAADITATSNADRSVYKTCNIPYSLAGGQ